MKLLPPGLYTINYGYSRLDRSTRDRKLQLIVISDSKEGNQYHTTARLVKEPENEYVMSFVRENWEMNEILPENCEVDYTWTEPDPEDPESNKILYWRAIHHKSPCVSALRELLKEGETYSAQVPNGNDITFTVTKKGIDRKGFWTDIENRDRMYWYKVSDGYYHTMPVGFVDKLRKAHGSAYFFVGSFSLLKNDFDETILRNVTKKGGLGTKEIVFIVLGVLILVIAISYLVGKAVKGHRARRRTLVESP